MRILLRILLLLIVFVVTFYAATFGMYYYTKGLCQ